MLISDAADCCSVAIYAGAAILFCWLAFVQAKLSNSYTVRDRWDGEQHKNSATKIYTHSDKKPHSKYVCIKRKPCQFPTKIEFYSRWRQSTMCGCILCYMRKPNREEFALNFGFWFESQIYNWTKYSHSVRVPIFFAVSALATQFIERNRDKKNAKKTCCAGNYIDKLCNCVVH